MTVVYFVQTHRDPQQIYRLVRTLRAGSGGGRIVVQHDFAASHLDWEPLQSLAGVHLLPSHTPHVRSHFSCQMEPYLDFLDWLEAQGFDYEWVVNLTGQCYPVTPVARIEARLRDSPHDGFLRFWDVLSPASPWSRRKARHRYWYRHWLLPKRWARPLRLLRGLSNFLPVHIYLDTVPWLGAPAWRSPFHGGFRCYGGWTWFSLRRAAVLYLRDFLAARPDVLSHYRRTRVPEESLVQTVLANSGRFDLADDDLRYIDYTGAVMGSPRTLTAADLPLLASGRYQFARKFDAADTALLDRIDRELLAVDAA